MTRRERSPLEVQPVSARGSYLVGVLRPGEPHDAVGGHLDELAALADTAGFAETGRAILPVRRLNAATFIGSGQADEVGLMARALGAEVVAFDEDLTPAQARNLEKAMDLPVVDRAGLIIEIFAQHARSREARSQVEMARLEYLLPRLAGRWNHLSRQVGGGPGGTKGEGEKQIELDRRMIRHRIDRLRRDLQRQGRARTVRRQGRGELPQVALVGYTNVGKSSLFNALAGAGVRVEDQLFATLDATVRRVDLGQRGALLLKDTVGFIRKLPHHLVESFKSTFEEAGEADLLLLVLDLAHPAGADQLETVERVLDDMALGHLPRWLVHSKADAAPPEAVAALRERMPGAHIVSAHTGEGLERLLAALGDRLLGRELTGTITIPSDRGDLLALAHRRGRVEHTESHDSVLELTVRASRDVFEELERQLGRETGP
jgi:GTP-binding protein HflX